MRKKNKEESVKRHERGGRRGRGKRGDGVVVGKCMIRGVKVAEDGRNEVVEKG